MNVAHVRRELKRKARPIRWLVSRVLLRTRLCSFFLIRSDGYVIRFHPSELSSDLWYDSKCRNEDIQFLKSYLKPGDSYVDVGANIGMWVLAAGMVVGKPGRVIAFEPHPRIFKFLQANVALNNLDNVHLHNCAVGDQSGSVSFSDVRADDTNRVLHSSDGLCVPMVTLNDILDSHSDIALLKVDAEGYEKYVLSGGEKAIEKVQCVFIEISQKDLNMFGCSDSDILTWLEAHGYGLYRMVASSVLAKVTPTAMRDIPVENIVALRSTDDFVKRTRWSIRD